MEDAFEEIDFELENDDENGPKAEALIDGPIAEAYKSNSEMPTFEHFPMKPEGEVNKNYRNLDDDDDREEETKSNTKMEDFSFADIEAAKMACIDEMQSRSQDAVDEEDDDYKVGYGLDNSDVYNMEPYEEEEDKQFEQPAWKQAFEQKKVLNNLIACLHSGTQSPLFRV